MPLRLQENLTGKALAEMLKVSWENGVDRLMKLYSLDALVSPTGSPAWSEPVLIEIAYSYEQGTKFSQPPGFIKSN